MVNGTYKIVADIECQLGEGPLWHPEEKLLYWTDIEGRLIYRLDPATGKSEVAFDPGMRVGGITLQLDGSLVIYGDNGAVLNWKGGELVTLIKEIPSEIGSRFNDVFAATGGRVFAGTMPKGDQLGTLYRIDPDLSLHVVKTEIGCSNGMGFTPDGKGMYYIDSAIRRIYRFDYDAATGELSNETVFIQCEDDGSVPDGMTVDAEGNLWVAFWGGHRVAAYGSDGVEKLRIKLPAARITAPTILPDGLMYLTSAGMGGRKEGDEYGGATFAVQLTVAGVLEHRTSLGA